jgi:hypothetical protein
VLLDNGATDNWIGVNSVAGPENADQRNGISGNGQQGVGIADGSADNVVAGDYIGTNAAGTAALGNSNRVDVYLGYT